MAQVISGRAVELARYGPITNTQVSSSNPAVRISESTSPAQSRPVAERGTSNRPAASSGYIATSNTSGTDGNGWFWWNTLVSTRYQVSPTARVSTAAEISSHGSRWAGGR